MTRIPTGPTRDLMTRIPTGLIRSLITRIPTRDLMTRMPTRMPTRSLTTAKETRSPRNQAIGGMLGIGLDVQVHSLQKKSMCNSKYLDLTGYLIISKLHLQ